MILNYSEKTTTTKNCRRNNNLTDNKIVDEIMKFNIDEYYVKHTKKRVLTSILDSKIFLLRRYNIYLYQNFI